MSVDVPHGLFRITAIATGVATAGRLGATPPTLSGGMGAWVEIPRPRRAPLTDPGSPSARRLTLEVLFDGWRTGESVENAIANLDRLSTAPPGSTSPVVRVGGQIPRTDLEWVIEDVSWGEAIWENGVRLRQAATIILLEHVVGKLLITTAQPLGGKPRLTKVHKGDNLKKIAARVLGNANRWREIAALNGRETYTLTAVMIGRYLKVPPR